MQDLVDEGLYDPLRDTQAYAPPQAFYDQAIEYYGGRGSFVTVGDYDTLDSELRVTNESLHLPTARSLTAVVAHVLDAAARA